MPKQVPSQGESRAGSQNLNRLRLSDFYKCSRKKVSQVRDMAHSWIPLAHDLDVVGGFTNFWQHVEIDRWLASDSLKPGLAPNALERPLGSTSL